MFVEVTVILETSYHILAVILTVIPEMGAVPFLFYYECKPGYFESILNFQHSKEMGVGRGCCLSLSPALPFLATPPP